jgi:hypothetical protein
MSGDAAATPKAPGPRAGAKTSEHWTALVPTLAAGLAAAFSDADPWVRVTALLVVGAVAVTYIRSRTDAKVSA